MSSSINNSEVVQQLEAKIEKLEEHRLDHIEEVLEEVVNNQHDFDKRLTKYEARWGMIIMVGTALLGGLKLFWEDLLRIVGKR